MARRPRAGAALAAVAGVMLATTAAAADFDVGWEATHAQKPGGRRYHHC